MTTSPSGARTTRYLLACGLAAPLFVVVILIEGALRPDYASLHHFGSELALGDRGWVQIANFIAAGVLMLGFALGLRRALPTGRGSRAAPILIGVFGACLIVGGVFPTDPHPGYPPGTTAFGEPTLPGLIHDANIVPFYAAFTATALVLAWRFAAEPGRGGWMWYCIATAVLVLATFGAAAFLYDAQTQTGTYHGLWQRLNLALALGWFGLLARSLLREQTGRRVQVPVTSPRV